MTGLTAPDSNGMGRYTESTVIPTSPQGFASVLNLPLDEISDEFTSFKSKTTQLPDPVTVEFGNSNFSITSTSVGANLPTSPFDTTISVPGLPVGTLVLIEVDITAVYSTGSELWLGINVSGAENLTASVNDSTSINTTEQNPMHMHRVIKTDTATDLVVRVAAWLGSAGTSTARRGRMTVTPLRVSE